MANTAFIQKLFFHNTRPANKHPRHKRPLQIAKISQPNDKAQVGIDVLANVSYRSTRNNKKNDLFRGRIRKCFK